MKSLISITTCNRINEIKKYIIPYIEFCNRNDDFDFLLALDGKNDEYIKFCDRFEIPLIYSDEREGVGISKNRVLKKFPDYDFYFFIEDDIELYDDRIFKIYIETAIKGNFHHLNHFGVSAYNHKIINEQKTGNYTVISKNRGGGYFNFFTKYGILQIGGFHTEFAKYKRFGHIEHTYRFYNNGLSKYYFNSIKETSNMLIIHFPPHVTKKDNKIRFKNDISDIENNIIEKKLKTFEIKTISKVYFNNYKMNYVKPIADYGTAKKQRYSLVDFSEKYKCYSDYFLFKHRISKNRIKSLYYLLVSIIFNPFNKLTRHYLKIKFGVNAAR